MADNWDYDRYLAYVDRAATVLGVPLVNSTEVANAGWGLRKLSRLEFEKLKELSEASPQLAERWMNRLQVGFDREKSQVAVEVEQMFSKVPFVGDASGQAKEDAA
jgi:hypothetical protein